MKRSSFHRTEDVYAKLANDPKQQYLDFISALVSVRVVLLQLVPAFTL